MIILTEKSASFLTIARSCSRAYSQISESVREVPNTFAWMIGSVEETAILDGRLLSKRKPFTRRLLSSNYSASALTHTRGMPERLPQLASGIRPARPERNHPRQDIPEYFERRSWFHGLQVVRYRRREIQRCVQT